jgi:hypothetical protein
MKVAHLSPLTQLKKMKGACLSPSKQLKEIGGIVGGLTAMIMFAFSPIKNAIMILEMLGTTRALSSLTIEIKQLLFSTITKK